MLFKTKRNVLNSEELPFYVPSSIKAHLANNATQMTPNVRKMVMCNMDNVAIPRPPALPLTPLTPSIFPLTTKATTKISSQNASVRSKDSSNSQGFRLLDSQHQDDTGSVYSIYKQKIDSMFESDSSSTKNSVQAKIEKMFCDVAQDNGIPMSEIGVHSFSVDYLGSVPLQDKVTSLAGLQNPLRELYFAYKKITRHKKPLTGRLEISSSGLKVQYQGEKGDLEQLNPFPTIAVWSAVKFVIHENATSSYAFLPLITDPDNIDKQSLFRNLDENERKFINNDAHSPLFAVVMRKIGVHKQLECHGFVCQTSEDAIVIAATLYKSLVAHMKAKEKKPKNRNGVTCMSIASSTFNDKNNLPIRPPRKKRSTTSSVISESDAQTISDTQPLLSNANKPPKKSIKTRRAPKAPEPKQDLDAIVPYEEVNNNSNENSGPQDQIKEIKPKTFSDKINTFMSREQKQITAEIKQVMSESATKGLKRVQSIRKLDEEPVVKKENSGDILTKVTIPRSGSFLNAGGLTRYKSKVSRNNDQTTGGSPLGFKEIFHELSLQEGLHSLDDILGVIIDPDGMSFNDLKPIYKEFLLKLSVTLTKDELYQRSKSIMRRQKKKLLRRNSSINTKKNHHVLVSRKFKRLKHVFQRNLKFKLNKGHKQGDKMKLNTEQLQNADGKLPESSISTSSYDTRQFRPKEEPLINKKQSYRKKTTELQRNRRDRTSTSEESDFFSLRRKTKMQTMNSNNQNRNSSSGYVSCSECSYDSDTCTCVSADKCYCSLGHKNFNKKSYSKIEEKCSCSSDNLTFCGCDTDSCTESNKCYCSTTPKNSTILEQLKQRGFIHSVEGNTRPSSRHKKLCKNNSNTRSTKSVEYMHNPSESYYEKMKSRVTKKQETDYELFTSNRNADLASLANVYAKNFIENGLYGMNKAGSIRSYDSNHYSSKSRVQSTAISSGGACSEALSVKKSAEIAALFADIKLSQTTDITHLAHRTAYDLESMISSRNDYNSIQSNAKYMRPNKMGMNKIDVKPTKYYNSQRIVSNSLYSNRINGVKANMYSAENGLYTIQSQSDESGRSSISERRRGHRLDDREYFELDQNFDDDLRNSNNVSNSLENSLGYLP